MFDTVMHTLMIEGLMILSCIVGWFLHSTYVTNVLKSVTSLAQGIVNELKPSTPVVSSTPVVQ